MLRSIERKFYKYLPEWIEQLHNSFHLIDSEEEGMQITYARKLEETYENCFVGDMRDAVGLPRKGYDVLEFEKPEGNQCIVCTEIAVGLMEDVEDEDRDSYLKDLKRFSLHLQRKHKVKL